MPTNTQNPNKGSRTPTGSVWTGLASENWAALAKIRLRSHPIVPYKLKARFIISKTTKASYLTCSDSVAERVKAFTTYLDRARSLLASSNLAQAAMLAPVEFSAAAS
ncbi:hypothetical protein QYF36_016103 [Acer negundo]|nr:hypothetical protein QYF36_016103 [Acer negundo]